MITTRDYSETIIARLKCDREFARLFYSGAVEMLLEGDTSRALSRLRDLVHAQITFEELAHKLEALERKALAQDKDLEEVFEALREVMTPPEPPRREIGFHTRSEDKDPAAKHRKIRKP
jgi:hypothetical protein